jgi:hypothetical protein
MHVLSLPWPPRNETISSVPEGPMPSCGHRDTKLPTNACRRELEDLTMAWYRGPPMRGWIFPNGVFASFPQQPTTMLTQVAEQVAPLHGAAICGTMRICDAAVSSKWMGSSKSASGSVHDGSGCGSGSPWSKAVSAISTKALASNRRASCRLSPAVMVPGKSNTSAWTPCSRNLYIAL